MGLIQEQQPERCALFLQWRQMDLPVLVDRLNLVRVSAVPLVWAIDEHGVLRRTRATPEQVEAEFLDRHFPPPDEEAAVVKLPAAEAAFLAGRLDDAVAGFRRRVAADPEAGRAWFGLGCALRARFDRSLAEGAPRVEDFREAIQAWGRALALEPANYIWRRRLQQYGPRLEKPYPFYDWVVTARQEIRARGETPVPLPVEPRGAELAAPRRSFPVATVPAADTGLSGVPEDLDHLVRVEAAVVPDPVRAGDTARVVLWFLPDPGRGVHWTNDAGPLRFRVRGDLEVDARLLEAPVPPDRERSAEPRSVEFELQVPAGAAQAPLALTGVADYGVCREDSGECLYLRQEVSVTLPVAR